MTYRSQFPPLRCLLSALVLGSLFLAISPASNRQGAPLPEDRGTAGTLAALQRLPVFVRVLQTVAHPDDENAGTLAWLARKAHARTALFSLTRGDGGQNILGDEKYEAMGLLRTGEFLEACRIYGAELYFATAFDFGFSKTAEETLSKWGRKETLEEMVRFIRYWRPTIILSRFQGTPGDGHGHHQAAGAITHEAFRAAGDPTMFPGYLDAGRHPWQAQKLYDARFSAGPGQDDWTVRVPIGDYDPVLGRSYREIGSEGYGKHRSQGNAAAFSMPGQTYDYFRLADSTVQIGNGEGSFFDSIDITLQAILGLAGDEKERVAFLRDSLAAAQDAATAALAGFEPARPGRSAADVARGTAILSGALSRVQKSDLSAPAKNAVLDAISQKLTDFHSALNAVLGVHLVARGDAATAVPGQKVLVTVDLFNRGSETIELRKKLLLMRDGWRSSPVSADAPGTLGPGSAASFKFEVEVPVDAAATEPFWYREDDRTSRYKTRPAANPFAPFGAPEITAMATYGFQDAEAVVESPVLAQVPDPLRGMQFIDIQAVPEFSVSVTPVSTVVPISRQPQTREYRVSVLNNRPSEARGTLRLNAPAGWQIVPRETQFTLSRKGEIFSRSIEVRIPAAPAEGSFMLEAAATLGGREYRRSCQVVSIPGSWTRHLYSPSSSIIRVADIRVAAGLTVGYVPGAGDEVPAAIEQLGAKVGMLSGEELAFGDLSRYSAIVTGIRAYNVNETLRSNYRRLLDYVHSGGTLIVQYNTPLGRGAASPFPYGPYPMSNSSSDRITVEDSPIRMLEAQNPVFTTPNKITQADFDGWVQERGLYFMSAWDSRYIPLLAGSDPGEEPKAGGMLVARYGKGWYVYTSYAWFRQLPAGVPGAYRIFANLLSLSHKTGSDPVLCGFWGKESPGEEDGGCADHIVIEP